MSEPTIEDINEARSIIYSHVVNDKLRNMLYRELNNIQDTLEASIKVEIKEASRKESV